MTFIRRKYSGSDAFMLETSTVLHKLFVEHQADFLALDANLNIDFSEKWMQAIMASYSFESNHTLSAIQQQKTEALQTQMQNCRDKYKEVKFFAEKAFKKNKVVMLQFGTAIYSRIYKNRHKLVTLMALLYKTCKKYQATLLAQGLTQVNIEEINELRIALLDLISEQSNFKKTKSTSTEERINILNQCYGFARLVIDAAFVIYKHDYARKQMFLYGLKTKKD